MSLLGGLLGVIGGKQDRKAAIAAADLQWQRQHKWAVNKFKYLRSGAMAAGFNPLTALGAGGLEENRFQPPALSSRAFEYEALGDSLGTVFNAAFAKDQEAEALKKRDMLRFVGAIPRTPRGTFGYDLTKVAVPQRVAGPALAYKLGDDPAMSDTGTDPAVKPLTVGGLSWKPSGAFSDADSIETRYGDVASWAYGAASGLFDAGYNLARLNDRVVVPWVKAHPPKFLVEWAKKRKADMSGNPGYPKNLWPAVRGWMDP